jgi:hypothetical protein
LATLQELREGNGGAVSHHTHHDMIAITLLLQHSKGSCMLRLTEVACAQAFRAVLQ